MLYLQIAELQSVELESPPKIAKLSHYLKPG